MQEDKLGQLWDSFFPYCAWVGRGEFYHPLLCTPSCLQIVLVHNAAPAEKLMIKSREQKLLEEMPSYIIPMNSFLWAFVYYVRGVLITDGLTDIAL